MSEFDDPELERMLGRASGAYPDANVAFETVRGRVRQVKRRRAIVASTAACALLFGAAAVAVRGGDTDANLRPSHSLDDQGSTESSAEATDATDESTTATENSVMETTVESTVPSTMVGGSGADMPGGTGHQSSGRGSTGGGSTATTVNTIAPTVPTAMVTTYSNAGGSLQIQIVHNKMVLVAETPAAGFTAHNTEVSGDKIRVEFSNGKKVYEIQLQFSDGKVTSSTQGKG